MKNIAFVFPGQGTHYTGMGKDIAQTFKEADEVFQQANDVMGIDIRKLCYEGPDSELVKTENSQPTIHTTSMAILKVLQNRGYDADVTAGFSLGQYAALAFAGSFKFEDSVQLVKKRGVGIQEVIAMGMGKMCFIVGLEREEIFQIVRDCRHLGHIQPSNYNCPGQIIVSGYNAPADHAQKLALERGAKAANFLSVSAPFHSTIITEGGIKLYHELVKVDVQNPKKRYVDNVTGEFFDEITNDLKTLLMEHVYKAVMWEDSVNAMLREGVDTFVEIGPKNLMTDFNRRTAEKAGVPVKCYNIEDVATLEEFMRNEKPVK